jgi:hypothetical protein
MLRCPGSNNISGTLTLTVKIVPVLFREIEILSIDKQVKCECGFIAYNDIQNCVTWCKYARECVGDAMYEKIAEKQNNNCDNTEA